MPVAYHTFRLLDTPDSYSPPPGALPLTRGALVPGHTSHRGAHGPSWCKSGAHPAVGIEMSAKLHQLWCVPSLERPWLLPGSYHCFLVNLTSSASFLHTPLPCQPHPTLATTAPYNIKERGFFYIWGAWPLIIVPGPVHVLSAAMMWAAGSWHLSIPLRFSWFRRAPSALC